MNFEYKNLLNNNKSKEFRFKVSIILSHIRHKALLGSLLGTGLTFLHPEQITAFPSYLDVKTLNGANGFKINGKVDGHRLGRSVSKAGDINADGFDDVIVATKFADEAYVVYGKSSGFPQDFEVSNLNGVNGFAIKATGQQYLRVGGGGDVNGDGIDDVIVGSPALGSLNTGKAYVIFGSEDPFPVSYDVSLLNGANGFVLEGWTPGSQFGYSVAIAKDINGDGLDDIVIGAPYDFGTESGGPGDLDGRAYVILGKNNFPASLSVGNLAGYGFSFAVPENPNSQQGAFSMRLGWSVSGTGDVNGDGFNDILVGAPRQHSVTDIGYGTDFAGITYVLFGQANLPEATIQSALITGITEQDEMGRCVSEGGDVNGDGIDDLAICSPLAAWDNGFIDGQSFILHGHTNFVDKQLSIQGIPGVPDYPDLTNGVLLIPDNYSSRSISSLGDMDGDGFSEVAIGNTGTFTPTCSVVRGNPLPYPDYLTQLSWQTKMVNTGRGFEIGSDALFGWVISEAGDVNGDGLADAIIGSPDANTPTKSKGGRAYVIFGQLNDPGDVDADGNVDLILQKENRVYAALMTNGFYTAKQKPLITLPTAQEKVAAVNDFDLDGQTDLLTQNGSIVNLRKGPIYAISSTFSLSLGHNIIASGNLVGDQVKGKLGYPDFITRSIFPITPANYYIYTNLANGSFSSPNFIYSSKGSSTNDNWLSGTGRFIDAEGPILTNQYADALIHKNWQINQPVYARKVGDIKYGFNEVALAFLPSSSVAGTGNFKKATKMSEIISVHNTTKKVYIGKLQIYSGYTLTEGARVVGPK